MKTNLTAKDDKSTSLGSKETFSPATNEKAPEKSGAGDLLNEAAQLLKSLRLAPTLKAMSISQLGGAVPHDGGDEGWILLDSGATHALRPAVDDTEWLAGQPTLVNLAEGTTTSFRLKSGTSILLSEPGTPPAWIIPMGGIAELGYLMQWSGGQCCLRDPDGKEVEVTVDRGCPMVSRRVGDEILQRLEIHQVGQLRKMEMIKALNAVEQGQAGDLNVEVALTAKLKNLFPDLPEEILMKVIPNLDSMHSAQLGEHLPWNRRKRRRIARATQVIVHVFAGPDHRFWERKLSSAETEVLCVDLLGPNPANLMDRHVFGYLLSIAASGKMKCLISGPPCRTISALRFQDDNGPKIVRTEQHPYGVPNMSPEDKVKVVTDVVLWFRNLTLYILAEEVRLPEEPQTDFILEQPEDPIRYRSDADIKRFGFMSVFRTAEWMAFQERYGISMVHFDQGAMGHDKRKPTSLAVVNKALLQLDELRGAPENAMSSEDFQAMEMEQRCKTSKLWSAWAPGLKEAIALAVQERLQGFEPGAADQLSPRQPKVRASLQPLSAVALERWKQHFLNDHFPARRDCAVCLRAQGRSRPHRRIQHADAFTLSVDLSGRLTPGEDQVGKRAKYFMVAVYTFPVTGDGQPLLQPPGQEEPQDHPIPPPDELEQADEPSGPDADDEVTAEDAAFLDEHLPLPDDDAPLPGEEMDDEVPPEQESKHEAAAKSAMTTWNRLIEETSNVTVKNLTFVEILESRHVRNVLPALARVHCRLRSLGLPLLRLHTDRARELVAAPVRQWCMDRGVVPTMTTGDSYKSNGRAEAEVNMTKKGMRAILDQGFCELGHWPLVARHVGERRLRFQLTQVGWPSSPLLRFGTKAFAVRKRWKDRYQDWRNVREEVQVFGPDVYASLTTPAYYVQSMEDNKFFFTDDLVIPNSEAPAAAIADEPEVYLVERGAAPAEAVWDAAPVRRRRLHGKQWVPALSMCHIEGEDRILACFPEMFEPSAKIPATRLQGGKRPALLQLVDATAEEYSQASDSWTLGTISGSSEEDALGGGDEEEAPNNRDGGSSPVASRSESSNSPLSSLASTPDIVHTPERLLRKRHQELSLRMMQFNLANYVNQELETLDVSSVSHSWWFPALTEAVLQKAQVEDTLIQLQRDKEQDQQVRLEDEFLVTKTINHQEVWQNLSAWEPSVRKEFDQLVNNKQAVRQITRDELRRLSQEENLPIEILPGKMVHTRKAGSGDYRSRAVVCGNYAEASTAECYAGGADGPLLRAMVKTCALKSWQLAASDVRVAFLNAPRRDRSKLVAMEIPRIFRQLGLASSEHLWLIDKALYGLTTSPRDWCLHRNEVLPTISWCIQESDATWKGCFSKTEDENLWRLKEVNQVTGEVRWAGLLAVYVDDLLMGGSEATLDAAMKAIADVWALSEPEWASETSAIKFCGFEITADANGDGYHLSQRSYEQEMLKKWEVTEKTSFPMFCRVTEEEEKPVEHIDPDELKRAQGIAGSLLWVATRTRPDVMYGVATMSRLMSKNPSCAVKIGMALLKYINRVPGGLHYSGVAEGWGKRDQLKVPRSQHLIEVFSDIAYASGSGHRSIEGLVVFFAGSPICWQSHQQAFATHSTAESELVSYNEALIAGKSTEALLCTMWDVPLRNTVFQRVMYGDNLAAIGLAHGTANSSWRTRHLRIRSSILRESLEDNPEFPGGQWKLLHLKGTELVADGMTKPLMGQAYERFLQDLGIHRPELAKSSSNGSPGLQQGAAAASLQVLVGATLLNQAQASNDDDNIESEGDGLWICGILLMVLGAVQAGQVLHSAATGCLRRLRASTGEVPCGLDKPCPSDVTPSEETASASSGALPAASASSSGRLPAAAGGSAAAPCIAAAGGLAAASGIAADGGLAAASGIAADGSFAAAPCIAAAGGSAAAPCIAAAGSFAAAPCIAAAGGLAALMAALRRLLALQRLAALRLLALQLMAALRLLALQLMAALRRLLALQRLAVWRQLAALRQPLALTLQRLPVLALQLRFLRALEVGSTPIQKTPGMFSNTV